MLLNRSETMTSQTESTNIVFERYTRLNIVPINLNFIYDLAIIASLRHEVPEDISRYTNLLKMEFGNRGINAQVFFADNTPNFDFKSSLERTKMELESVYLHFEYQHVPKAGKIHGLNAGLANAQSPYVMMVDPNKNPDPLTLLRLYEQIKKKGSPDLISSTTVNSIRPNKKIQTWNVGAAHIGRRLCFPGFPPLLSDDIYTMRLALAQGKTFAVAPNLIVRDLKGEVLSHRQNLEREARWKASQTQLNNLIIVDGQQKLRLRFQKKEKNLHTDSDVIQKLSKIFLKEGYRFPYIVLIKILARLSKLQDDSYFNNKVKEYKEQLYANPEMCTWDL